MYLFVYGTLMSNIPSSMSKFLRRRGTLIGKGTVVGTLYDLGQYPGFVAGGEGKVKGELYRLEEARAEQTMEMLDAYESVTGAPEDEYRKIELKVTVGDGGTFTAVTYEFTKSVVDKKTIPLGNYSAFYPTNTEHQRFVNGG
ncbi:gamma-glutamylcyclotransferase family protein [Neolewinella agarilytica]|uniref:Uncharacterized conserved protein YtfP, gamma-glutamylcyclotransferase (GGCT)/AIG2-like family n=1 Tax=Neolewinella agarilytica TaxID=478744 RepID=A0A1H9CAW7_9BACT|nr:gamma-glutamylcyclotransferase family protein [Neolewinella agarilytica]SEP98395.1 Uncharacterized conserved protein YtfP, gamma-glutamylcyclotransferase (GGCT)/AIG2-like family [Neolewinella agarilytica]